MKTKQIFAVLFGFLSVTIGLFAAPVGAADDSCKTARAALKEGDAVLAVERGKMCRELNPEDFQANYTLAKSLALNGEEEKAIPYFEKAVQLKGGHVYALNNLGLLRLGRGEWKEAEEVLARAVALDPDLGYVYNNHGVALERLGRLDEAFEAYGKAVEIDPGHSRAAESLRRVVERLEREENDGC